MTIAERLELIRAFIGGFQKEFAERVDVSPRAYTDYLSGKRLPPSDMLHKLADEGFDVTWLLTGKTPRILGEPKGAWTEKPPRFSVPEKDSWLLEEAFMVALLEGIAHCYADAAVPLSSAELGRVAVQIVGDIAVVSHSAEQRDSALKMALLQLRRRISG